MGKIAIEDAIKALDDIDRRKGTPDLHEHIAKKYGISEGQARFLIASVAWKRLVGIPKFHQHLAKRLFS